MIALFPSDDREPVDPRPQVAAEARPTPVSPGTQRPRPWVLTNMIASADGATAVDGLSGPLGGPADQTMFGALRAVADAIIVGASTVRQERYRPPPTSEAAQTERAKAGRTERALIVVVTASLDLDPDLPLFTEPGYRPLVATVAEAPAARRQRLEAVADLANYGQQRVDLMALLGDLWTRGLATVLAEGGPALNGQLVAQGLIDEWNLTLAPLLVGGPSARAAMGHDLVPGGLGLELSRVWLADDLLFCRWVRPEASTPA